MSSFLFRVGKFSFRHKWWVIGAWVAALAVVIGSVAALSPKFAQDFELPGTDGGDAIEVMQQEFPAVTESQELASTTILISATDGLAQHSGQIDELVADLRELPEVLNKDAIVNPLAIAAADPALSDQVLSQNGEIGLITVPQGINTMDVSTSDKEELVSVLEEHRGDGLQVEATSGVMSAMEQGGTAEMLGFAVAFVVMIVAFGALVAAFIPLLTAIVGVGLTFMLVNLAAEFVSINASATGIIMMLGIALSIDYALFIVSRYRTEIPRGGEPADAAGRAVGTAGTAVLFAGLTVVVAVAALAVIGIPMITQMGLGAALAVIVAVLGALTLIPALLGATGRFAFLPKIPWIKHAGPQDDADTLGVKFGRTVVAKPIPFIVVSLALLAAAAIPIKGMTLGLDMTSRDEIPAQELLKEGFGEGINGQLFAVISSDNGQDVTAVADKAVTEIKVLDDVYKPETLVWMGNGTADPENPNVGATAAIVTVTPISAPSSEATHDLMEQIRALAPGVKEQGATLNVGGQTAIMSDLSAKLDDALIPYIAVVVGLAFLIMIGVFRSLWVPLIGTLGFVFSVLATFGITTLIFTDGWAGLIDHPQPLLSFLPIFLVGVVFGLAMDYQVFLVTRMREEFMHGMAPKDAIIAGYRHGSRVVTSAAIIMISVFAAFMLAPETTSKMMGFALAIAVFFDAFIIRMIVVPAVISLLGKRAWGLPGWLDKLVLNFDIEGSTVRNRGVQLSAEEEVELKPAPAH